MIFETIISSVDSAGKVHVAPFGVRYEQESWVIAPFRPSTTLDNILATQTAVINVCDDVRVFAGALTGRQVWTCVPADKVLGVRLESCLSHKELRLLELVEDAVRPQLRMQVVHEAQHQPFQGFNRAQAAVIELAVLVSRLKMLPPEKIEQELAYLTIAVEKTAGPREQEAWDWLLAAVRRHQSEGGASA